jgi:hypothetical protein
MKTCGGVEVLAAPFLASVVDGGEWSASRPGLFTPGEKSLVPFQCEAGWPCADEKNLLPLPGIELRPRSRRNTMLFIYLFRYGTGSSKLVTVLILNILNLAFYRSCEKLLGHAIIKAERRFFQNVKLN